VYGCAVERPSAAAKGDGGFHHHEGAHSTTSFVSVMTVGSHNALQVLNLFLHHRTVLSHVLLQPRPATPSPNGTAQLRKKFAGHAIESVEGQVHLGCGRIGSRVVDIDSRHEICWTASFGRTRVEVVGWPSVWRRGASWTHAWSFVIVMCSHKVPVVAGVDRVLR
jgi:hypothetical protein